jgi:hypothetical protein
MARLMGNRPAQMVLPEGCFLVIQLWLHLGVVSRMLITGFFKEEKGCEAFNLC